MKRRRTFAIVVAFLVAPALRAGVGVWTATSNSSAGTVVTGPDGTVYTDWDSLQVARSTDHGVSWQPFPGPGSIGASFYQTRVLAVDAGDNIYVAFNTGHGADFRGELYVSRDGGTSWSLLRGDTGTEYLDLRIDPSSAGTLFLLSGIIDPTESGPPAFGRLSRSTDSGAHWTEIDQALIGTTGITSVTAFTLDFRTPGRLYAALVVAELEPLAPVFTPVFESSDRGTTWTELTPNTPAIFTALLVDPFQPSTVYGSAPGGILRSEDAGQTFVFQSVIPTVQIVADSLHAGRLYAASPANGVLMSSDGGTTWTPFNAGLASLDVGALALDAPGGFLYAVTGSGVFVNLIPGPGTLVLNAAHPFTVTLSATDPHTGATATGVATQANDLWGYFSIPAITNNPGNPEVFVKLLDGTAINGEYWFFYGGLTNLEYTLTVTDSTTGAQKTYTKPAGSECGGSDTAAFGP
jgi:hypothetical protein